MNRTDIRTQRFSNKLRNIADRKKSLVVFLRAAALSVSVFFFLSACRIPNLETPECAAARQTVKEFYSYHFGNDMKFTAENLKPREKFLTPELTDGLQKFLSESDPFTLTGDLPKAFRVGGCKTQAPDKTELQVLLFWKDDARSEQREINVEVVRRNAGEGDRWLINNIFNNSANLRDTVNHE